MQLIPRYLVNNRTTIIANEAGFVTEYRPVYSRQLKVYKGIDNVLEFRILNADQKPIDVSNYTPKFQAFDENDNLVIEHDGVAITGDDSAAVRGLFKITVTDNDLLNIKSQYLKYNIHLINSSAEAVITYSNTHFGNDGVIYVSSEAFPGPRATYSVTTFSQTDTNEWTSEHLNAEPAINGNEALHTAVIYADNYTGDVIVEATLDNQVTNQTGWATIDTLSFTGSETEPAPVNFNGVFSYLRFKTTADPANKISKILVRN